MGLNSANQAVHADVVATGQPEVGLLAGNLNVPAGEWQGFDIDWIEAQIRERAGQGTVRKAIGRAMRAVRGASAARADWDRLKALLAAKEA